MKQQLHSVPCGRAYATHYSQADGLFELSNSPSSLNFSDQQELPKHV